MQTSVSKIGHIVLKVEDLDSALAFYCGVLGLKEVARRDFGEGPMAFLSTGNSQKSVTHSRTCTRSSRHSPPTASSSTCPWTIR